MVFLFFVFLTVGVQVSNSGKFVSPLAHSIKCSVGGPPPAWPGRATVEEGRKSWDGPKPISLIGSTGSIGTQVHDFFSTACIYSIIGRVNHHKLME